jgi:hypothetical protein
MNGPSSLRHPAFQEYRDAQVGQQSDAILTYYPSDLFIVPLQEGAPHVHLLSFE